MASSTSTTTITITLEPLGRRHCEHILEQLERALYLSSRILKNTNKFSRKEYRAAYNNLHHPDRDAFELSVYPFQSLYELLGKKLAASSSIYHTELGRFSAVRRWCSEGNPLFREMRNKIAHNFNAGEIYRGREEEIYPEDSGPVNPPFSAGAYFDLVMEEVPALVISLREMIAVFEAEIPLLALKKTAEMVEEERWDPTPQEGDVPAEWGTGEEEWGAAEEGVKEWGMQEAWGAPEDTTPNDNEDRDSDCVWAGEGVSGVEDIDSSTPWSSEGEEEEEEEETGVEEEGPDDITSDDVRSGQGEAVENIDFSASRFVEGCLSRLMRLGIVVRCRPCRE